MVRLGALDALRMHQQDPGLALTSASALHLRGELELDGEDLRREPLQVRKATLASALAKGKRRDLPYRSGRSKCWVKLKNPASPAMLRVLDETW
jgi:hypothetical protein